jgi:hypothetical protein
MEVHQHTHTPRKKWTHYFWEFLMLFLAVFCGFLAENQREHYVEQKRERQYMQSLLRDLELDTAAINTTIANKAIRVRALDSVFIFFNTNKNEKSITGKLFKLIRRSTWNPNIERHNVTISQLKNAGGMRLIRKKNVADSITAYDWAWEDRDYNNNNKEYNRLAQNYAEKLVNYTDLLSFYITNRTGSVTTNIPDTVIIQIDPDLLSEQVNFMMLQKNFHIGQIETFRNLVEDAKRLMELIKKEYHLK